ncbi:SCAR/WAVE family protein [Tanacetum coccineum]
MPTGSYSTQSEDNNTKEPSSDSNLQRNSYLDSASLDGDSRVPDENIHDIYLAEHSSSRSPYITWDEKLEIIDSTGRPNDTTDITCTTEKIHSEEKEDPNSRVVNHIDNSFHDEPIQSPVIVRGQPDEIEKLKQYSSLNNKDAEMMHEAGHLGDSSTSFEFHLPEITSAGKAKLIPPKSHMKSNTSSKNENYEDMVDLVNRVTKQIMDEKLGRTVTRVVLPRIVMHSRYHYMVAVDSIWKACPEAGGPVQFLGFNGSCPNNRNGNGKCLKNFMNAQRDLVGLIAVLVDWLILMTVVPFVPAVVLKLLLEYFLQPPLQPLMDNLEAQTYETFEKDNYFTLPIFNISHLWLFVSAYLMISIKILWKKSVKSQKQ